VLGADEALVTCGWAASQRGRLPQVASDHRREGRRSRSVELFRAVFSAGPFLTSRSPPARPSSVTPRTDRVTLIRPRAGRSRGGAPVHTKRRVSRASTRGPGRQVAKQKQLHDPRVKRRRARRRKWSSTARGRCGTGVSSGGSRGSVGEGRCPAVQTAGLPMITSELLGVFANVI
jgi:hypothetical protein